MSLRVQALGQIALVCQDVARATAFYRDVLGVPFLFSAGPNLAFFQLGEVRLMLTVNENPDFAGTSTLYFRVDDLDAAWEALRPQATLIGEPRLIADMGDYELWMGFFQDSEGNAHALMAERARAGGQTGG